MENQTIKINLISKSSFCGYVVAGLIADTDKYVITEMNPSKKICHVVGASNITAAQVFLLDYVKRFGRKYVVLWELEGLREVCPGLFTDEAGKEVCHE